MTTISANLGEYLNMIADGAKTPVDALYELTEKECVFKHEKAIRACIKTAGFPFEKTIKDFDFSFQPSVCREEIEDLASLRFIEANENILFIGSSGVGKTHLATAIGIEASRNRYSVHYITFQDLITELKKAEIENRLDKRIKSFVRYRLLIIDELWEARHNSSRRMHFFQHVTLLKQCCRKLINVPRKIRCARRFRRSLAHAEVHKTATSVILQSC